MLLLLLHVCMYLCILLWYCLPCTFEQVCCPPTGHVTRLSLGWCPENTMTQSPPLPLPRRMSASLCTTRRHQGHVCRLPPRHVLFIYTVLCIWIVLFIDAFVQAMCLRNVFFFNTAAAVVVTL